MFLLVLLAVSVIGLFSIWRLADYHTYSAVLSQRFFQSTQFIGDLNNFTSDFRAAEATGVLSRSANETAANANERQELDREIARAQRSFEQVEHDDDEIAVYTDFRQKWSAYRKMADSVLALSQAGLQVEATELYMTNSRLAYDAASDTLGQLTDLNVKKARLATLAASSAYYEARLITTLAVIFAVLSVAAGFAYVRHFIANPILELAGCMRKLARNETDVDIPLGSRRDEIGEMTRAVMIFREHVIELGITQRTMADQATLLSEKLLAEQRLTQMQRNFISMASHEFRTPLTNIDGYAQRLINAKSRFNPDDVAERAGKIRSAILRITSVIDNLIDSSRLMDGETKLYFHPSEFDLRLLLNEVCQLHREVVPGADFYQKFGTSPLWIVGDRKLLFQVFSNLLSNAIKYSPDNKPIRIIAKTTSDQVAVVVEDHGVGIPERDISRLFERYFRASNVSGIVGTGVGLYLVKTVIDLHHGDIAVKSREGHGSSFTVYLPLSLRSRAEVPTLALQSSEI